MGRLLGSILILSVVLPAADLSAGLLSAAAAGNTGDVKALLDKGAKIESTDKNQRTPLMLAAQHGHADTVKLLLSRGARTDARDHLGWTAYGLALLSPAGHGDHQAVLQALPVPPRIRLAVDAAWLPARVESSCFMSRGELPGEVGKLRLDRVVREEFLAFAAASGKGLVDIVRDPAEPADALASLSVVPGIVCGGAAGDNLSLSIDVRLFRSRDKRVLYEKSFGGGFKGLRTQTVNNPEQYAPVFLNWIRPQAGPIYWGVVEMLYRSEL